MTEAKKHIYEESSQYRHWRFSPSELWELRQSCNSKTIQRVREYIMEEQDVQDIDFITADEQVKLCRYYEQQLQTICAYLKLPDVCMATAVIYTKRFFLRNSIMDYHPKDILLTCLFLSTKSEGERMSIDEFGKNLQIPNTEMILKLEFIVSQGLRFEYLIHHPYRAAYGHYLDIQRVFHKNGELDMSLLKDTYDRVKDVIGKILLTDLPLIYQPAQLAVAAFIIAGKNNGFDIKVKEYLVQRLDKDLVDTLYTMTILMDEVLEESQQVPLELAQGIDKRLQSCRNPLKNPESKL
ncbi:cyclin-like protein [Hesseltinella vesiculosa]|uniref:Cyclin-like protein n=1 Tax=Hesseltinella vesiculosa TaxID=101127 RepID=A0A1X2GIR8_9FUNG|nr:cyclin-like protein [Hesseltinella vesiculosa]